MQYNNIYEGVFLSRPNRFIANVLINGEEKVAHVKNTGRCKELLQPGAKIYLQHIVKATRTTEYDLISVYKGDKLINMDSQVPNKVFGEWLPKAGLFKDITLIRPEYTYKNSRFDFYVETNNQKILIEVKGVTLEKDGVVLFPDAPTERGVKHIKELAQSLKEGYLAYIVFIAQMDNIKYFTPNKAMHKEFATTLKNAQQEGLNILALQCNITKNSLSIKNEIDFYL